jgi:carnosine synthase
MSHPPRTVRRRCPECLLPVLRDRADDTAQAVRRALLRSARVLVVRAGYPGEEVKRKYFERAAALGVKIVLLHHTEDQVHGLEQLQADGLVEQVLELDLNNDEQVRRAVDSTGPFDGVVTFIEFGLLPAAQLAKQLGLVGNDPEVVRIGRDKELTRRRSLECGVTGPRFYRISREADTESAARAVGFPAVLKPVGGLTAIEVHRVRGAAELASQYRATQHRLRSNTHANPGILKAVADGGLDMILEEYLDGREFDVDLLLSDGALVYGSVTDNQTAPDWPCVQIGANMPSTLLLEDNEDWLIGTAARWTRRLGYTDGAFHVELKMRADGTPVLLEINARIGGASQYELNADVWGVDLVEEILLCSVGIPIRPLKASVPRRWYAARYLLAPRSGTVTSDTFLDALRFDGDVRELVREPWVRAGETVNGPGTGPPDWLGEVTVGAPSLAAATGALDSALRNLELPIASTPH